MQLVCTPNATEPPTYGNFEAFGGPMARSRWAQQPLIWVPMGAQVPVLSPNHHPNPSQEQWNGLLKHRMFQVPLNSLPSVKTLSPHWQGAIWGGGGLVVPSPPPCPGTSNV